MKKIISCKFFIIKKCSFMEHVERLLHKPIHHLHLPRWPHGRNIIPTSFVRQTLHVSWPVTSDTFGSSGSAGVLLRLFIDSVLLTGWELGRLGAGVVSGSTVLDDDVWRSWAWGSVKVGWSIWSGTAGGENSCTALTTSSSRWKSLSPFCN